MDPWGNIISEADEKVGFISAKIDTKLVKDIKKKCLQQQITLFEK